MSFREMRSFREMMFSLGYPRIVSMENFRSSNFALMAEMLKWLVKQYDPAADFPTETDTEQDRIIFVKSCAQLMAVKAHIALNTKNLYQADGYAVRELLKIASVLFQAVKEADQSVDVNILNLNFNSFSADDDDGFVADAVIADIQAQRVDLQTSRRLGSEVASKGANLSDHLSREPELRQLRDLAIDRPLQVGEVEAGVLAAKRAVEEDLDKADARLAEVTADRKNLEQRIEKKMGEVTRNKRRLSTLNSVNPPWMDEFKRMEVDVARLYKEYLERFRNVVYMERRIEILEEEEQLKMEEQGCRRHSNLTQPLQSSYVDIDDDFDEIRTVGQKVSKDTPWGSKSMNQGRAGGQGAGGTGKLKRKTSVGWVPIKEEEDDDDDDDKEDEKLTKMTRKEMKKKGKKEFSTNQIESGSNSQSRRDAIHRSSADAASAADPAADAAASPYAKRQPTKPKKRQQPQPQQQQQQQQQQNRKSGLSTLINRLTVKTKAKRNVNQNCEEGGVGGGGGGGGAGRGGVAFVDEVFRELEKEFDDAVALETGAYDVSRGAVRIPANPRDFKTGAGTDVSGAGGTGDVRRGGGGGGGAAGDNDDWRSTEEEEEEEEDEDDDDEDEEEEDVGDNIVVVGEAVDNNDNNNECYGIRRPTSPIKRMRGPGTASTMTMRPRNRRRQNFGSMGDESQSEEDDADDNDDDEVHDDDEEEDDDDEEEENLEIELNRMAYDGEEGEASSEDNF